MSIDFDVDEWELYDSLVSMNEEVAKIIEKREAVELPKAALNWIEGVTKYSVYNDYPAAMSYFVTLGQILKDSVRVAVLGTPLDIRIHFCWIQTARTGKTTMFDFLQPTWTLLFSLVNDYPMSPQFEEITGKRVRGRLSGLNMFTLENPDAFTDQALLGTIKTNQLNERWQAGENNPVDENGDPERQFIDITVNGALYGSGFIAFDEFEHSGIFKDSQHKQDTVMMFQKFMNKLDSDTHLIKKRLTDWKEPLIVDCQRSLWATTLPPQGLEAVILTKGVFQRMWLYVREIPPSLKAKMEDIYLDSFGIIRDTEEDDIDFEKYANQLYDTYLWVQKRLQETGDKRTITVFQKEALNRLKVVNKGMRRHMDNYEGVQMYEALDSFRMNTINNMGIAATLCAISEKSPVVTARHIDQAKILTDSSFDSITDWFSMKLKGGDTRTQSKKVEHIVISCYEETKKKSNATDGWVTKTSVIQTYLKKTKKARATFYRLWAKAEHLFEVEKRDKKVYMRRATNDE